MTALCWSFDTWCQQASNDYTALNREDCWTKYLGQPPIDSLEKIPFGDALLLHFPALHQRELQLNNYINIIHKIQKKTYKANPLKV